MVMNLKREPGAIRLPRPIYAVKGAEECTSCPHEVKEAALAHTGRNRVERAYRRTDLFDKRRDLMDQWGRFCLSAGRAGDVVELRR